MESAARKRDSQEGRSSSWKSFLRKTCCPPDSAPPDPLVRTEWQWRGLSRASPTGPRSSRGPISARWAPFLWRSVLWRNRAPDYWWPSLLYQNAF